MTLPAALHLSFLRYFTGHVIPAEHLLAVALDRGPSGKELDFTFQSRDCSELVKVAERTENNAEKKDRFQTNIAVSGPFM